MAGTKNVEIVIGEGITEVCYFTSIRDAIINYPYPNTLKVLKITGHQLKQAISEL